MALMKNFVLTVLFFSIAVMANDGLITLDKTVIRVLPRGRLLIRNICMVFDSYLRQGQQQRFSKVI